MHINTILKNSASEKMAGVVDCFLMEFTKRELSKCEDVLRSQAVQCSPVRETDHAFTGLLNILDFHYTSRLGSWGRDSMTKLFCTVNRKWGGLLQ